MAQELERKFIQFVKATAMKAQQQTFDTIDELSADKAAMVAEKNFKIVERYRNRST